MRHEKRSITLINAPFNLGLRPLHPGHVPGTWRAPRVLGNVGMQDAFAAADVAELHRPAYAFREQVGARLANGQDIREFNLELANAVEAVVRKGNVPVVVGGDCSILLGALAGARRISPLSIVHIDGHSDFRHPGNYDASKGLGTVAGMDLALATGRGEPLLRDWPDVPTPLIPDAQVVQIGERENRDPDYPWSDINSTAITQIDIFAAREIGPTEVLDRTRAVLDRTGWPFWVHLDVDILDQTVMPAVDSPGSPGMDPADLVDLLSGLMEDSRWAGMTVTIFDPDLDPDGIHARLIVSLLRDAFA